MSLLPPSPRLSVTIMQTPEAHTQFWIPELDDVYHYLAGISTNALMGLGAFTALTTYWLAFQKKAIKPRVDPNQQSVELPVCGLFILVTCFLIIQTRARVQSECSGYPVQ